MGERRSRIGIAAGMAWLCALVVAAPAGAATGDLGAVSCISGDSVTAAACTQRPLANAGGEETGLDEPQTVTVSPNGASVYVTSQQDDAIAHFERNAATGALTFVDCITGETPSGPAVDGGSGACAATSTVTANGQFSGLLEPSDAVISGNGAWVYVTALGDDAVTRFSRDTTTGSLTFVDCVSGNTGTSGVCTTPVSATGSGANSGFDAPSGIALGPGGTNIYVTAQNDASIIEFDRTPANGAISFDECISAETVTATTACSAANDDSATGDGTGLGTPFSPVVSGDGDAVYLSSFGDASVAWFNRAANGNLTWNDCITGDLDSGPASAAAACGTAIAGATAIGEGSNSGMERTVTIEISPDDEDLYSGSQTDAAVSHFTRNLANEDLTFSECLSGESLTGIACTDIPTATTNGPNSGLYFTQDLAVSPDGKTIYAAAAGDAAITSFNRAVTSGNLTWRACQTGATATVSASCTGQNATAGGAGSGLAGLRGLAVTPDGEELVGAAQDDASVPFLVRTNAPQTSIISPPDPPNDPTPTFSFTADESPVIFQCRVDVGLFSACTSPFTTASLSDGTHTFEVRALNDALTPDPTPASSTFTVDTTAPDTSISAGPTGTVNTSDVEFTFAGSGDVVGLQCRLDGAAFALCTSPRTLSALSDGSHTFEVRAFDTNSNFDATPASQTFSVDATAPETSLVKGPKAKLKLKKGKEKAKVKFTFSADESGSTFECQKDKGKSFKPCNSPYSKKFKKGKHTFKVRATDAAGNLDSTAVAVKFKVKK